jgi:hypothetical protein
MKLTKNNRYIEFLDKITDEIIEKLNEAEEKLRQHEEKTNCRVLARVDYHISLNFGKIVHPLEKTWNIESEASENEILS